MVIRIKATERICNFCLKKGKNTECFTFRLNIQYYLRSIISYTSLISMLLRPFFCIDMRLTATHFFLFCRKLQHYPCIERSNYLSFSLFLSIQKYYPDPSCEWRGEISGYSMTNENA